MPVKIPEREYRAFQAEYSLDDANESALIIRGTPVVFDTPTMLCEIEGVKYYEQICRGAFDGTDMSDFIFNVNHEMTPYARSKNGSLKYEIKDGFEIEARLDPSDERHRQLYGDIKSGRIDKMSFSFTIADDGFEYDENTHLRKITRVKKLYDVSAVTFPAYQQTSISARGFFEEEFRKEFALMEHERRRKIYLKSLT